MLTSSQFLTSGSRIKKKSSSLIPSTHQSLKANIPKDFLISQESTRQLLVKDLEENESEEDEEKLDCVICIGSTGKKLSKM